MSSDARRPPAVGELLPRAREAFNVRYKLGTYSLDIKHDAGGPKAQGFALILGITLANIDYLAAQIMDGILRTPIGAVEDRPPHGTNCIVDLHIRGLNAHSHRIVNVRTAWLVADADTPPRLVSAYVKP